MEDFLAKGRELVTAFGFRLITALVILAVGRWLAKFLRILVGSVLGKRKTDPALVSFIESLVYFAILTFTALAALAQLGIQTTSFIAVIGAAGLAIGLSLQGSLANLAAGVLMLVFRPFEVGDYIAGAGVEGIVEEIHIFSTQLATLDNKAIIIPNAKLTGDNITNFTRKEIRRVDLVFAVGYGEDIEKTRRAIAGVLEGDARVLKDPPATIAVQGIQAGKVEFAVRPWVRTGEYWNVFFDTNENIKKRFDAEGIRGAVPQLEAHVVRA